MANNYYQQPQYYQPQNIYQQLGAPQPQQRGALQIQQRLALVQTQHQQQNQSLVPQRLQSLQQQPVQSANVFQQQVARPRQLQIQQRPQTVHPTGQQLLHYQAQPLPPQQVQVSTAQYPYPDHVKQTPFASRVGPQQPGAVSVPPQSQRRPLPQPRPGSTSPTRSRPLPAPTPGPSSKKSDPNAANKIPIWSQLQNVTKPSASSAELPKRGRASPPKFSIAPISFSNLGTSTYSSPSSPSSVSSLSADSFSGSPVRGSPVRAATDPACINHKAGSQASTSTFSSSSLSRLKSEFAGIEYPTVPKALVPGGKMLPAWKRTLPDVLPPLLPTPPPNPVEQQTKLHRQPQQPQDGQQPEQPPQRSQPKQLQLSNQQPARSQQQRQTQRPIQSALPPPIPSHSKPKPKPPSTATLPEWTYQTVSEQEDGSDEEEDDGDEEEEEYEEGDDEQYYSESEAESTSSNGKVLSSPNYGILDLPSRNTASAAFPHPGSMPRPPAMVGSGSITSSSASGSGFGSGSGFQAGWSKQEVNTQSMTMRLATSGSDSDSESAISLPRPPMMGMGGSNHSTPTKRSQDLILDDTPPPRSNLISQRGQRRNSSSAQQQSPSHAPQTPGKRALPMPQSQTTPTQSSQRRPQSQIYNSTTPRQPPAMSIRPQSQFYSTPLKQEDGNGTGSQGLQRTRSFGRGRELPKTPGKDQQQQPRAPPSQPQQPQHHHPQRSHSQPRSRQEFSSTIPNISIESPAPRGGRDRRADLGRMESESEGESERGHEQEHVVHSPVPVPLINIHPEGEERPRDNAQGAGFPQTNVQGVPKISVQEVPQINIQSAPQINVQEVPQINVQRVPQINIQDVPRFNASDVSQTNARDAGKKPRQGSKVQVYEVPGISVSGPGGPESSSGSGPQIVTRRGGLRCGGCGESIVGRIVNAMKQRWHPGCFRCTVCGELLEHVSSYEWEGKAYCHLDYHENFAPKCYSCKTPIYEERFISLDDPALGKRAYHEQHFFCGECGDPFLAPSIDHPSSRTGELTVSGDGDFASDDVGFTVYRGHPYCEACHVRLRLPKCKRCKRSIRDHDQAVEALGGKWCWSCFVCKGCQRPFEDPSFFEREGEPYCENCFSIILRNEL